MNARPVMRTAIAAEEQVQRRVHRTRDRELDATRETCLNSTLFRAITW